jgi:hypothetical protein
MSSLGFGALLAIFLAAGAATWIAGLYLSRATDVLDDRFHLGEAVGGMLLLGDAYPSLRSLHRRRSEGISRSPRETCWAAS